MFEASSFSFVLSFSFVQIYLFFIEFSSNFPQLRSFPHLPPLLLAIEYRIYLFSYIYSFILNYFLLFCWSISFDVFLQEFLSSRLVFAFKCLFHSLFTKFQHFLKLHQKPTTNSNLINRIKKKENLMADKRINLISR